MAVIILITHIVSSPLLIELTTRPYLCNTYFSLAMKFFTLLITVLSIYYQQVLIKAQSYSLSVFVPSDATITEFSGSVKVPVIFSAGNYYFWFGLRTKQLLVLQGLLNSNSRTCLWGNGWFWEYIPLIWVDGPASIPERQWVNFNFSYINNAPGWLAVLGTPDEPFYFSHFFGVGKFILVFIFSLLHYNC
jgi:hypothetical protein